MGRERSGSHLDKSWRSVRLPTSNTPAITTCMKWHPPQEPFVKISVDAAFFQETMQTGMGCVLRDWRGESIAFRTQHREGLMTTREGEAWGVFEALNWATSMGFSNLIVETDAQEVSMAINSSTSDDSLFGDYVVECKKLIAARQNYKVVWISRNANVVAHSLARMSRNFESPYSWVKPPIFVEGLPDVCHFC